MNDFLKSAQDDIKTHPKQRRSRFALGWKPDTPAQTRTPYFDTIILTINKFVMWAMENS